jgi:predicted SprT family Zn-dependent metalloprotease
MGKNGNILVGYETPPVTTLANCDKCGRALTTKYWVWDKARQEIIVVGAEHLPDAMGRFRLLPKKLRHWERKLTKLQELAQVEKSLAKAVFGSTKPMHKYVTRIGTPGNYRYVYRVIPIDSGHLDELAADTITRTVAHELQHGDLGIQSIRFEPHSRAKVLMFVRLSTRQLCYTTKCAALNLHLRIQKQPTPQLWLNRVNRIDNNDRDRMTVWLQHRIAQGYTELVDTTQYLSAPINRFDRKEIIRRGTLHELGHFRWLRGGKAMRKEFSELLTDPDVSAQLPSHYAMVSEIEAFAECFVVYRLRLLDERNRLAIPDEVKMFMDKHVGVQQ